MKKSYSIAITASSLLLLGAGCSGGSTPAADDTAPAAAADDAPAAANDTQMDVLKDSIVPTSITLYEENDSGQQGTATLEDVFGKTRVTLTITNPPADITQPAHIHMDECNSIGSVEYPLTDLLNGQSVTILDTPLDQIRSEAPLSINVHKSNDEAGIYVACGEIEP